MNLHEHQAKELLAGFGVAVPKGAVALSDAEIGVAGDAPRLEVTPFRGVRHAAAAQ